MLLVTWFPVYVHFPTLDLWSCCENLCHKQMDKVCVNEQICEHRQQLLEANRTKCTLFLSEIKHCINKLS